MQRNYGEFKFQLYTIEIEGSAKYQLRVPEPKYYLSNFRVIVTHWLYAHEHCTCLRSLMNRVFFFFFCKKPNLTYLSIKRFDYSAIFPFRRFINDMGIFRHTFVAFKMFNHSRSDGRKYRGTNGFVSSINKV